MEPMTTKETQRELGRARELLDELDFGVDEVEPGADPVALGAAAGIGFESEPPRVRFDVYVFDDELTGASVGDQLQDEAKARNLDAVAAINGPLLLFGAVSIEGANGIERQGRLHAIAAAFADR
jgi:hypothetical protein